MIPTLAKRPLFVSVGIGLAILFSASTWFYVNRIFRAEQIAEAAAHNRPRGNLSDLYPRWLGARELLLHHRNPYSPEITREIQQGYYGRPLDPSRPEDPKDQQGFAYPVYIVFPLAPTVGLPFDDVQIGFRWLLIALAVVDVLLWLGVLRWDVSCTTKIILAVMVVGWLPMVQGIKLQQLTLIVAALLAASAAVLGCTISRAPFAREVVLFASGMILAFATIKPQLAWPLVLFLLLWALSQWRTRRVFLFGFGSTMILLFAGAELLLPGWLRMFITAIGQYHQYTQNQSVLVYFFGSILGRVFEVIAVLGCALYAWRIRREAAESMTFGHAVALILALTVLVVPMFAPYNQVLLIPAVLILLRSASRPMLPALRIAYIVAFLTVAWPWIAAFLLTLSSPWLTPDLRQRLYLTPFYSNFEVPIFVFGLVLLEAWMNLPSPLRDRAAAE